jgi:hypothetical protein
MTSTRESPDTPQGIARGVHITNLCLLFAAALGVLPWLFAPKPTHTLAVVAPRTVAAEAPFAIAGEGEGELSAPGSAAAPAGARREPVTAAGNSAVQLAIYAP